MSGPPTDPAEVTAGTSTEEDGQFVTLATSVIADITEVRFYEDTVQKIRMGHREVPIGYPSLDEAIVNGLTNPTHIESRKSGSYLFVDASTTNQSGDPMRMPMKIIDGTSARLQSVYFAETTGDNPNVIWRSTDVKK